MARSLKTGSGQAGNALPLSGGHIVPDSSDGDVLTITAHSSQAGDLFNISANANSTDDSLELINVNSSGETRIKLIQSVAITSASTAYTVLSSNSGKRHIVPGFSSGAKITLPAHDAGLNYQFYIKAVTASAGVSFVLPSSPGTIVHGAVTDAASIVAATAADMVGGAMIDLWSDGTNWFMSYNDAGSTAAALITVAAT